MVNLGRLSAALLMLVTGICTAQNRIIPHEIKSVININHEGTMGNMGVGDLVLSYPYLYCSGLPGLATINVSDPLNPVLTSERQTSSGKSYELAISQGHLFMANWTQPLRVYSLANPAGPAYVFHNNQNEEHFAGWLCIAYGSYLHTSESSGDTKTRIWTYDISNPASPRELAYHVPFNRTTKGLWRFGDTLYFTNNHKLHWADVSNENAINVLGWRPLSGLGFRMARDGGYLYVTCKDLTNSPDVYGGLRIFSIADPRNPIEVGYWGGNEGPGDVHVQAGMAFLAAGGNELITLDVTDPTNPRKIAHTAIEDFPTKVTGDGKYIYVGSVSDNRRPEEFWGGKMTILQVLEDTATPTSTPTATPSPTPTIMRGDMDADGDLDLFDTLRMIDILLTRPPDPSPYELLAGDMDDDGDVDLFDVLELVEILIHGP